jgi:hypothetical protein
MADINYNHWLFAPDPPEKPQKAESTGRNKRK